MKILVVGVNNFGQMHLSGIKDMEISIVERKEEVIKQTKKMYDIKNVYNSYDDALKDDFDIVDLVVPHYLHREMSIKAMKNGNNVLLEKPIATNLEDAEAMIETSKECSVKFMVTDQYFFDPSIREAVKLIKNNQIGKINTIIVRDQRNFDHGGWRTSSEKMGGGALIDGGIHYIDTLLNFGGDYEEVYGKSKHAGSILSGEDTTTAIFKFKNGSTGLFYYSWSYRNPPEVPAFEIIGDSGSIYEDINSRSSWKTGEKNRTVYGDLILNGEKMGLKKYDIYTEEIKEFADSVKNGTEVPFPPELALRDLKAVLDIYKNS
jgi:predicted dehydrogenase